MKKSRSTGNFFFSDDDWRLYGRAGNDAFMHKLQLKKTSENLGYKDWIHADPSWEAPGWIVFFCFCVFGLVRVKTDQSASSGEDADWQRKGGEINSQGNRETEIQCQRGRCSWSVWSQLDDNILLRRRTTGLIYSNYSKLTLKHKCICSIVSEKKKFTNFRSRCTTMLC